MNVLSILGSPRRRGNTARVLGWLEEELECTGHAVEHVNIIDFTVGGCRECYQCRSTPDEPGCVVEDDGNALFERMIAADAVVFATPVFCWGVSSQLKALLDRMTCLSNHLLEGTRTALVSTAAGPYEGNLQFVAEPYRSLVEYLRCRNAGEVCVPGCSTPDKIGDDVRKAAEALARKLTEE